MTKSSVRQKFRFSIAKVLILVAVLAVILACYSSLSSGYRQSRNSAEAIRAAGGSVLWSSDSFFRNAKFPCIVQVDLLNCELTDTEYAALAKIPDYFLLIIDSKSFDQDTMCKLAEIEFLSGLSLEPDSVSDAAVKEFQELRPDIIVMVGMNGQSPYREYSRLND